MKRIQIALNQLSNVFLIMDGVYGPKTAAAVVAFKEAQVPPLRQSWQSVADDIVGIRTIKALDLQMHDLENAPPPPMPGFISLTPQGFPPHNHDHSHDCDNTFRDGDDFRGRISHHGTPIRPQRGGRMLCIGGTNEAKYLGFENFIPDPRLDPSMSLEAVHGRPFTSTLPNHCASDICFRSAPIDSFMKKELKRLAMPRCRLTYASNSGQVASVMEYLMSLGPQIQFAVVDKVPSGDPLALGGLHVVVVSMANLA